MLGSMRLPWTLALGFLAYHLALARPPAKRHYDTHDYYVLEHNPNAPSGASLADVAQALRVEVVEQAGELPYHWLVRREKSFAGLTSREPLSDPVIDMFESLRARVSARELSERSIDILRARSVVSSVKYLARQNLRQRVKRAPPPIRPTPESNSSSRAVAKRLGIEDPLFPNQWHLVNDEYPEHMMNATPIWEMGFTGKGVISALVDDGLDYESVDLAENFDADDSYDYNDHTDLPTPKLWDDHHGTRCAGQIAAVRNTACGVGIAYNSKVAGLRILSGPITDIDEAAALNYGFQNVSIYSCSWGPADNGQTMEGPGYLIKKAVVHGINNGRSGKGSIFVFASGNGAAHGDQCNFDGYTNSIYSVTVSAVDYKGLHPYYSEPCAANMIVAYSSGSGQHIVTTDKGTNSCTTTHGGTSAAAPNAVGVFALALEARPDLTWRDIQHLCIETARMINPEDPDWEPTAQGRLYSYKYGFGVLDAYIYVKAAQDWELVKPQAWFETHTIQIAGGTMNNLSEFSGGQLIPPGGVTSSMTITKDILEKNNFEKLEHINVKVWIQHTKRGDVEVEIVSPNGIKSVLAAPRSGDLAITGYPGWTFMTVKHWGEDPVGDWTIKVSDQAVPLANGSFLGWDMTFWGSTIDPSQAKIYEVPLVDNLLPPPYESDPAVTAPTASTKTHPRPTSYLPDGHGTAVGENSNPAFPTKQQDTTSPTESPAAPAPDEGLFPDMSKLLSNQKWFFGAIGAVVLFGIGSGIFFWRRRVIRLRRANYASVPAGDDLSMTTMGDGLSSARRGGPRTRELYDAFGEVSDDEDADERTNLRGVHPHERSPGGLGFHSGFLDDDEPPSAGSPTTKYRDDPEGADLPEDGRRHRPEDRAASPSVSGDGSWEHASHSPV